MCFSVPVKIKKIKGKSAILQDGRVISINLIKEVRKGDWLLTYANLAVEKISAQEAKKILKLFNDTK